MITPSGKPFDAITAVTREQDVLIIRTEQGLLHITPKSERIFRIRYTHSELPHGTPLGFQETPAFANWRWVDTSDSIRLETTQVVLTISKADTSITYRDSEGKLLLAEGRRALEAFDAPSQEMEWTEVQTPDGVKRVLKAKSGQKLFHTWLHFSFQPEERLFGLGQEEEGLLNLRGSTHYLHQANRKIAIPFLLSTMGWAILWSSASPAIFQDTQFGSYFFTEADEAMDYGASSQPIEAEKTHSVYLPAGADWYDFHTGAHYDGGQTIVVDADIDHIPLFVRRGSILPTVKSAISTKEAFRAPLEITVYPGANGEFTLYSDEGDSYGYEQGQYSTICLAWDDAAQVLTIGARQGSYPGMPETMKMTVRTVNGPTQRIVYTGQQLLLNLPR